MSLLRAAAALVVTACGCANIAGFDELSPDCPPNARDCAEDGGAGAAGTAGASGSAGNAGTTASGGTTANGGAAGSGGSMGSVGAGSGSGGTGAGSGECGDKAPGFENHGPTMAKIQRGDSCFWIDTTEVTEEQFAEYLASNPTPSDDPLCTGEPTLSDACKRATSPDAARVEAHLPKTCVDWCQARAFCRWAGKDLCKDDLGAIGTQRLLAESDFFAACTESGGENPASLGPDCGSRVCNVNGGAPAPVGVTSCFTQAADPETKVYDLIGNVSEWTRWCFANEESTDCAVRGSYFSSTRTHQCCEELSQLNRRQTLTSVGFRCCDARP